MLSPLPDRSKPDNCPGVLIPHPAADGGLVRVRLPGGQVTAGQWQALLDAAVEFGDGALELTSRGNVQLRGVAPGAEAELGARLAELLPSRTHEKVRNILASPLSGVAGGLADVRRLPRALDRSLQLNARLAELSGRFLFAIDDGRGDVSALGADVAVLATGPDEFVLVLGGEPTGQRMRSAAVSATMVLAALAFLTEREAQGSKAWRLAELRDGAARVADRLTLRPSIVSIVHAVTPPVSVPGGGGPGLVGRIARNDGREALGLLAPLGRFQASQAPTGHDLIVTPWRGLIIPDLEPGTAVQHGLIDDPESPWIGVTSCAGQPGCAKALSDVRGDAAVAHQGIPGGLPVHWSGCGRRCGTPAGPHVEVLATDAGYEINGVGAVELAADITAARRVAGQ
ncbi:hypothetical protein [Longispora albida]|uniref:hypothetical protein n=1 Tax=Longispora albida TaxID=203523 RepID=UPI00036C4722|nr:hypothetical protein [Longispora albida]